MATKRAILIACLSLISFSLSAQAGTKDDAWLGVERWVAAFNSNQLEDIVAAYTPSAILLGTSAHDLLVGPDQLRQYFTNSVRNKAKVRIEEPSTMVLSDGAVIFVGFYEFSGTPPGGEPTTTPARYTFLVVKEGDEWRIQHHHSSARPKAN